MDDLQNSLIGKSPDRVITLNGLAVLFNWVDLSPVALMPVLGLSLCYVGEVVLVRHTADLLAGYGSIIEHQPTFHDRLYTHS